MDFLAHIIKEFDSHQIESVKLRYITDWDQKLYDIYKKGFTCDFQQLHSDIKKITDNTINYICSCEFNFCKEKEYTQNRYNELNEIYQLMTDFEDITDEYRKQYTSYEAERTQKKIIEGKDPDEWLIGDVDFSMLSYRKYFSYDKFSDKELTLLVMGAYFDRYPYIYEKFELINTWSRENKIIKLNRSILKLSNCLSNISKHIQKIQTILVFNTNLPS